MISCQGGAMSIVAPKGRKHLSADALFRLVRSSFATITDARGEEVEIPLTDALMTAFAMFSLKSPSLLAVDKQRIKGNLETINGISRWPLLSGPRWCGVFFPPDDSLCVVSAKSPSQRVDHLLSSDVGCSAYPSGFP